MCGISDVCEPGGHALDASAPAPGADAGHPSWYQGARAAPPRLAANTDDAEGNEEASEPSGGPLCP